MNAQTSVLPYALTQIPLESLLRLALRFRQGEHTYGKDNWRQGAGDPAYQEERANHALAHLLQHIDNLTRQLPDEDDDHLAAIAWYCVTQMELVRTESLKAKTPARQAKKPDIAASLGEVALLWNDEVFQQSNGAAETREAKHVTAPSNTRRFAALSPIMQAEIRYGYRPDQPDAPWWLCPDDSGTFFVVSASSAPTPAAELITDIPRG